MKNLIVAGLLSVVLLAVCSTDASAHGRHGFYRCGVRICAPAVRVVAAPYYPPRVAYYAPPVYYAAPRPYCAPAYYGHPHYRPRYEHRHWR